MSLSPLSRLPFQQTVGHVHLAELLAKAGPGLEGVPSTHQQPRCPCFPGARWFTPRTAEQGGSWRVCFPSPCFSPSPPFLFHSPMQGTTLIPLLGFGFLFGGRSAGEDCDQAVLQFCRHRQGVRNDLWRLDPVTNAWYAHRGFVRWSPSLCTNDDLGGVAIKHNTGYKSMLAM